VNLGRVLIAAFMVAIFLGPRRWMAWAAGLRERIRVVRAVLRAHRAPGAGAIPPSPDEPPSGGDGPRTGAHEPPPGGHEPSTGVHEPSPGAGGSLPRD
jgi:hypothetical protein